MHIRLIAIGRGMPDWVRQGYDAYVRRLPHPWRLDLVELKPAPGRDAAARVADEGRRLLNAVPPRARVVALDERGSLMTTAELAAALRRWSEHGDDLALLVGGADGLGDAVRAAAPQHWSLSPLTLPHMLVRVIVAEQVYRAWSVLHNHPYHRGG